MRAIPCIWLDATYVKCRRGGRVASTAVFRQEDLSKKSIGN